MNIKQFFQNPLIKMSGFFSKEEGALYLALRRYVSAKTHSLSKDNERILLYKVGLFLNDLSAFRNIETHSDFLAAYLCVKGRINVQKALLTKLDKVRTSQLLFRRVAGLMDIDDVFDFAVPFRNLYLELCKYRKEVQPEK
jgi:hypothetical protein